MRLSLVIPAYRAASWIAGSVTEARTALERTLDGDMFEIIVVDDGSGDGTAQKARDGGANLVIDLAVNQGKGAAVRAGIAQSTGRVVVFTDADLSYDPAQIAGFVKHVEAGADVVTGDRQHPASSIDGNVSQVRSIGSRMINLSCRVLLGLKTADSQCGLKAFRGDVAKRLFASSSENRFGFDAEILYLARRAGMDVRNAPVVLRAGGSLAAGGVLRDGVAILLALVRTRLRGARVT